MMKLTAAAVAALTVMHCCPEAWAQNAAPAAPSSAEPAAAAPPAAGMRIERGNRNTSGSRNNIANLSPERQAEMRKRTLARTEEMLKRAGIAEEKSAKFLELEGKRIDAMINGETQNLNSMRLQQNDLLTTADREKVSNARREIMMEMRNSRGTSGTRGMMGGGRMGGGMMNINQGGGSSIEASPAAPQAQ